MVSPGCTRCMAAFSVASGAAAVPEAASLPLVATYQVRVAEGVGVAVVGGAGAVVVVVEPGGVAPSGSIFHCCAQVPLVW
jgi:hypothetical protein